MHEFVFCACSCMPQANTERHARQACNAALQTSLQAAHSSPPQDRTKIEGGLCALGLPHHGVHGHCWEVGALKDVSAQTRPMHEPPCAVSPSALLRTRMPALRQEDHDRKPVKKPALWAQVKISTQECRQFEPRACRPGKPPKQQHSRECNTLRDAVQGKGDNTAFQGLGRLLWSPSCQGQGPFPCHLLLCDIIKHAEPVQLQCLPGHVWQAMLLMVLAKPLLTACIRCWQDAGLSFMNQLMLLIMQRMIHTA